MSADQPTEDQAMAGTSDAAATPAAAVEETVQVAASDGKEPEAPTPLEQADDEAIVSAVNEAAEQLADEAAASLDVNMTNAEESAAEPATTESKEVDSTALVDNPAEAEVKEAAPTREEAKSEEKTEEKETSEVEAKESDMPAAAEGAEVPKAEEKPADASATTTPSKETTAPEDPASENKGKPKVKKETKKRIRRVGKTPPRKVAKQDEAATPASAATAAASAVAPDTPAATSGEEAAAAVAVAAAQANLQANLPPESIPRVLSKHDEKWNSMFEKLVIYKNEHNSSLVPQCYDQDARLGRWVHYQRVEYWIYQQSGNGKITPDRISRLEAIGFEWDPQRAQWNLMFDKLKQFKEEVGHCKVPKGYTKDPELANWVRNQRLEHANMAKGKRSRMTDDRFQKLDSLGFKWSTTMPSKGATPIKSATMEQTEQDAATSEAKETTEKAGESSTTAETPAAVKAENGDFKDATAELNKEEIVKQETSAEGLSFGLAPAFTEEANIEATAPDLPEPTETVEI